MGKKRVWSKTAVEYKSKLTGIRPMKSITEREHDS